MFCQCESYRLLIFTLLVYFLTGLQRSAGQYFVFFVTIFMASVFGSSLCFFISAVIPDFGRFHSFASLFQTSDTMIIFVVLVVASIVCCTHLCNNDGFQWFSSGAGQRLQVALLDSMDQRFSIFIGCIDCE